MDKTHDRNITFLKKLFARENFDWLIEGESATVEYFASGGGTHLYLITDASSKYLARINFFPGKNEWKVKQQEYLALQFVESMGIGPRVYYFSDDNELGQDLTIVDYIRGEHISILTDQVVKDLAHVLSKLHTGVFDYPDEFDVSLGKGPYRCELFDSFAGGPDKKIEQYSDKKDIQKVIPIFNETKMMLGGWFNNQTIFDDCDKFCLCHGDLKSENILVTDTGVMLIDWEGAELNIPELDLGWLFSGCGFSREQEELFMNSYHSGNSADISRDRAHAVRAVLDFFRIIEDYLSLARKTWDAQKMIDEIAAYREKYKDIGFSNLSR